MKLIKLFITIALIIFSFVLFVQYFPDLYSKLNLKLPEIKRGLDKEISLPRPFIYDKESDQAFLTKAGVIEWTNIQRERNGLAPLKENTILNEMAMEKVNDMFKNQYFEHTSPSGVEVDDLAKDLNYEFLAIGENLALGNFQNDDVLVDAWMKSPGHRENILNKSYQEIGVAVAKGVFEGKTTWLAVQHFGLSVANCPQTDSLLKAKIEENKDKIFLLKRDLDRLEEEIAQMRADGRKRSEYNQKIEEYNSLVSQYNAIIQENKILINQYNAQIDLLNLCIKGV